MKLETSQLFTLQLDSNPENVVLVENLVEELADKYKFSEDTFANMMICLNEATINAIIHGNKFDSEKKVYINVEIDPKRAIWTIKDEGEGFNYLSLPDPTAQENIENYTGRGVFFF